MPVPASICEFGRPAADFVLPAVDGGTYRLADIRGEHATLIVFLCNHCPYVQAAIDRIVMEAAELRQLGVGIAAISSNDTDAYPQDDFGAMAQFAAANRFTFPYLFDESQDVARAYDAQCTPDFFGFNRSLELQYRGRLDSAGPYPPKGPVDRELYIAMQQIIETGHGPTNQIASMGCSIKWRRQMAQ